MKDLFVKSTYDVEKYERSLYNEVDGWKIVQIDGLSL